MENTQRNWLIGGVALVALALIGIGAWLFYRSNNTPTDTSTPTPAAGDDIDLSTISTTTRVGGYTITPVPQSDAPPAPDYKKPIPVSASVSAEARVAIQAQHAEVVTLLNNNPKDLSTWLRLGVLHKIAGDYTGAERVWVYVTKVWPTDYAVFGNLGDLYRIEGRTAEAKAAYKTAIENAAGSADLVAMYQAEFNSF